MASNPPLLQNQLDLVRCPHCNVADPNLRFKAGLDTTHHSGTNRRLWKVYACERCGGAVLAAAQADGHPVLEVYPSMGELDSAIPEPARTYLSQAIESLHAPAGSVMLCASSVDAMLKSKEYKAGSLYQRIDKARDDGLITPGMAEWAHAVRLEANDPRHADERNPLPDEKAAHRCCDFVRALAELLFVLPARVKQGHDAAVEANGGGVAQP